MGVLAVAACALAALLLRSFPRCPSSERILAAAVAAVATVFVALIAFVHPSGDDYPFAIALRDADPWTALARYYLGWTGRYTAVAATMAVTAAHPLVWACRVAIALVIVLGTWALAVIARSIGGAAFSRAQAAWIAVATMCVLAAAMPSTAEGLYWPSAVLSYQLGSVLSLAAVAFLVDRSASRGGVGCAAAAAFLVAGCNEGSLAVLAVVLVAGVAQRRLACGIWDRAWLIVAGAFALGAAIALTAPGNRVRLAQLGHEPHVLDALAAAFRVGMASIGGWLMEPAVAAAAAVVAAWSWSREPGGLRLRVVLPAWPMAVVAAHAPACAALGLSPPPRVLDVAFTVFLIGLLVAVHAAAPRLRAALIVGGTRRTAVALSTIGAGAVLVSLGTVPWIPAGGEVAVLGLLVAALLLMVYGRSRRLDIVALLRERRAEVAALTLAIALAACGNAPQALIDLVAHAPVRSRELAQREAWLEERAGALRVPVRVPLPDPRHRPATIAYMDITSDPAGWMNAAYAAYYGVPAITVDPRVAVPTAMPER